MTVEKLRTLLKQRYGFDEVRVASIGGSATWGMRWPEQLPEAGPKAVVAQFRTETPFGPTATIKLIEVCNLPVIRVPVHGWQKPAASVEHSLATFWLLKELGVRRVIVDASVGGIDLEPWDVLVASDFIDVHHKKEMVPFIRTAKLNPWRRMANPFCPCLREELIAVAQEAAKVGPLGEIVTEGVYYTTPLGVFESAAEINSYGWQNANVVGQSTGPEAMLARICGMCFGGIYIVANYAEGSGPSEDGVAKWIEGGMESFYRTCALPMGQIVWQTLTRIVVKGDWDCPCQKIASSIDLSEFPVEGA